MGANQSEIKLSFNNPYSKDMVNIPSKSYKKRRPRETATPINKEQSIKGSPQDGPPAEETPPAVGSPEYVAAEFDKNNKYWEDRLNRLEESHKLITQTMLEANAQAQVEMEKILPKVTEKDAQPPCKSLLDQVMKCYQSNAKETLKCTSEVKAYKSCMGEAMNVIVNTKDVDPLPDDCLKELILDELKKREAAKVKSKTDQKKK